ncbi:hypothetical protein CGCF415_v013748 [Colletotrichum fructicola]|nr:hypothetical protein CGCF415_v013748 [Colletotrichum fructicola]KAF5498760.1 hypothetical protein CGCF413_v007255 [Colletotrichum fructicola]
MASQSKSSSSSVLPYEVLLIIVEYLIAGVEARQNGEIAWIYFRHDVPCKLAVSDHDRQGRPFAEAMKNRYSDLRLPSQINQKSRKMVNQTFRPVPMFHRDNFSDDTQGPILPVSALILPEVDAFIPYHAGRQPEYTYREDYFNQTMHLPSPKSHAILDLIQIIHISSITSLNSYNKEALDALLALPNLRNITVDIGIFRADLEDIETFHGGLQPLLSYDELFPYLRFWDLERNLYSIWSQLENKGIKLYGTIELEGRPKQCVVEIFPSADGDRVHYVNANCPCCPGVPMSERRKMPFELRAELGE